MKYHFNPTFLKILLFFIITCPLFAESKTDTLLYSENQSNNYETDLPALFASDEIIELTLKTDLHALKWDIGENPRYHPAVISYTTADGLHVSIDLRVITRGHFRKYRINCDFPPLKLNFGNNTTNTIFEGQDKIKLVTHCRDKRKLFEQYILQEYLIYKIYNLFTDFSFRARLVRITYIDTEGKHDPIEKYAFFIENANEMAKRNGGTIAKIKALPQTKTNYDLMTLLCVFQYFVGNTDWSVPALHNIKLVQPDLSFQAPAAIPYDFDFCGVINTFYASPDTLLDILSVKKRLFRSSCRTIEELQEVFDLFVDHKDEIYNLYYKLGLIEEKNINNVIRYYEKFYAIITKPRLIRKEFIRSCIE